MRGHIIKRYKDSYTIVLNLGRDPATGKRKQQWISVKGNKKEAEKRLAELLHLLDTGMFMKPAKTTFAEYIDRWLADYRTRLSPRGYERYAGIIKKHIIPCLGNISLTQLKPEHLQQHYTLWQKNGLSSRTVRYHHAVLHVALETAVKWGLLVRNPADAVDPPRARHNEMKTWGEYEINRFVETAKNNRYYALFYTALFTGMRRSELLGLRWSDIDFIMSQIYVRRGLHHLKDGSYIYTEPKSATSRRTIALSPSAILVLRDHYTKRKLECMGLGIKFTEDDLVFCTVDGAPIRPNTVTRAWTTLATKAGLKIIRLHDARHTHASVMLKQGIHPKVVQERLGHSSIQMTLDTYSHVAPGIQAAAANRFDEVITNKGADRTAERVG
jgi:integrase